MTRRGVADSERYLRRYLQRAPAALALWRSIEARHFASVPMPRPLLDVGAGFGEFGGAFFEPECPPEVGLDISRGDLDLCRRAGVYRSVVQGDAREMPFSGGSFATVMSVSVLEHIPDVARVFAEMRRVIRPHGTLVFSVPLVDMESYMLVPPIARRMGLGGAGAAYARRVHRAFKHVNLHEPGVWLDHARTHGFEVIEHRRIISCTATRLFDLGLPTALLSQPGRMRGGGRTVWRPRVAVNGWARLLRGVVAREESDGSNLFVVARAC